MQNRTPLNVVCALVFHSGRVLATRRDPNRSFPLLWEFPGGKLEAGESGEEALHRELEEELKLQVEIIEALDQVEYDENGHHICLHPFVCRPALPWAPVPLDHVEIRWVTPYEALQLTWAPADIPLLKNLERLST
ncbi:MAG TPA: (deoxy)nucleoside triphosphate pyrophosphohydrolase [Oceanipulchritudo sp.]|nr:(deoxy)nucleoside triphosphate pyrophosphohydrolase [Oceanipulchritudo sp.]